jgi:hypothetical protein
MIPPSCSLSLAYRPIPTTQSRRITLNGTPNNHIITYGIRTSNQMFRVLSSTSVLALRHVLLGAPVGQRHRLA